MAVNEPPHNFALDTIQKLINIAPEWIPMLGTAEVRDGLITILAKAALPIDMKRILVILNAMANARVGSVNAALGTAALRDVCITKMRNFTSTKQDFDVCVQPLLAFVRSITSDDAAIKAVFGIGSMRTLLVELWSLLHLSGATGDVQALANELLSSVCAPLGASALEGIKQSSVLTSAAAGDLSVRSLCASLHWHMGTTSDGVEDERLVVSEDIRRIPQLWAFVASRYRTQGFGAAAKIEKAVLVSRRGTAVSSFTTIHEDSSLGRSTNDALRKNFADTPSRIAVLNKLKSIFEQNSLAPLPSGAQLLFVWHGTAVSNVASICRDGPRNFRTTDAGYFGAGQYFALEAEYAARYSVPDDSGLRAVILFAVSVSQVYPVTLEEDYVNNRRAVSPHRYGFSKFYSGDAKTAIALAQKCDAHFIPVKHCGTLHPVTGENTTNALDYQATPAAAATAHELVINSEHRCLPIAVLYFRL